MPGWKLSRRQKSRIRARRAQGWPIARLATAYDVTTKAIYDIIGRRREVPRITPAEIRAIQALRNSHTQRETARRAGRSRATIQRMERDGLISAPPKIMAAPPATKKRAFRLRIPKDGETR